VIISINSINFTLSDPNEDLMNYYFTLETTLFKEEHKNVNSGDFSLHLPFQLEYGVEYKWWLNVTDNMQWTNSSFTFHTQPEPEPESQPDPKNPIPVVPLMIILGVASFSLIAVLIRFIIRK
jgi:hypothetical protein